MNKLLRPFLAFVSFLAANFFSYWMFFGHLFPDSLLFIGGWCALLTGIAAAVFVWRKTEGNEHGLLASIVLGALLIGGLSFAAGFFGPMILWPEANQGPLFGLFISGPLGFIGGAIAGGLWWAWKRKVNKTLLAILCSLTALYASEPAWAFTPTPQEACCLSVMQGQPDSTLCHEPLPSKEACQNMIQRMGNAAQAHWQALNQQETADHKGHGAHPLPSSNKNPPLLLIFLSLLALLLGIATIRRCSKKTKDSPPQSTCAPYFGNIIKGALFFTFSTLNFMIFAATVSFYSVMLLSALYSPESAPTILVVYFLAVIPLWLAIFTILMRKLIKGKITGKASLIIAIINILGLAAIYLLDMG